MCHRRRKRVPTAKGLKALGKAQSPQVPFRTPGSKPRVCYHVPFGAATEGARRNPHHAAGRLKTPEPTAIMRPSEAIRRALTKARLRVRRSTHASSSPACADPQAGPKSRDRETARRPLPAKLRRRCSPARRCQPGAGSGYRPAPPCRCPTVDFSRRGLDGL